MVLLKLLFFKLLYPLLGLVGQQELWLPTFSSMFKVEPSFVLLVQYRGSPQTGTVCGLEETGLGEKV